jgi:hypothetical protein
VLVGLAKDAGLVCVSNLEATVTGAEAREGKFPSWWVVLAPAVADLASLSKDPRWITVSPLPGQRVWTDDFSNIVSILRFN